MAALGCNMELPDCGWGRGYDCCDYYGWGGCGWGWRDYSCGYWGGGYYYNPYFASSYYVPQYAVTQAVADAPATIVVNLPADARLTINGQSTQSTSGERRFVSPPLQPGKTFSYTLQARIDRDGQSATVSREVEVRAGLQSRVTLEFPVRTARK
jgi:uncharacterized protein (TIGR03000 family)